ncbi:MAG: YchJ family protein [Spirochaetales bacterium]|nr:YchJ family protein [Spirochaetales bacterium]
MKNCHCGNPIEFEKCCEPYIKGMLNPPTAEDLMRARYSAYVTGDIDFIESTHSLDQRDGVDVEETRKWSQESDWKGLQILGTKKGKANDNEGSVEFKATYVQNGMTNIHHEMSTFKKVDGKWYFEEGKVVPVTVVRSEAKVGRNDPCPCGSGKKYKKCCG